MRYKDTTPEEPPPKWLDHLAKNFYYLNGELYKVGRKPAIGSIGKEEYKTVVLRWPGNRKEYKNFKVHHIIWFLHHKSWPTDEIDHINNCRFDNRIENLRVVTRQENLDKVNRPF